MEVQANENDEEEVSQDGGKIRGQEQDIEQVLVFWLDGQAQEEKLWDENLVPS